MATHFVIDTETLGVYPDAVVLSLAIVPFEFENLRGSFMDYVSSGLSLKLSVEDQIRKYGRKIEPETMQWWKEQGDEAKAILKPSGRDKTVQDALDAFDEFLENNGYEPKESWLWSRGNLFDFGKVESLYRKAGRPEPYVHYMVRDIRTMIDCFCGTSRGRIKPLGEREGFILHNALHDAANDAMTMTEIFQQMMKD